MKMFMKKNEMKVSKGGILVPEGVEESIENQRLQKDAEEARRLLLEADLIKQKELEARLQDLEILPMFDKIIILPYPTNPYKKFMENGIIVEYNGIFDNPDTGTKSKAEPGIACGKVIEVGPTTKYLKVGDDVFYNNATIVTLPFFGQGYFVTHETGVLAVVSQKLKERFGMNG